MAFRPRSAPWPGSPVAYRPLPCRPLHPAARQWCCAPRHCSQLQLRPVCVCTWVGPATRTVQVGRSSRGGRGWPVVMRTRPLARVVSSAAPGRITLLFNASSPARQTRLAATTVQEPSPSMVFFSFFLCHQHLLPSSSCAPSAGACGGCQAGRRPCPGAAMAAQRLPALRAMPGRRGGRRRCAAPARLGLAVEAALLTLEPAPCAHGRAGSNSGCLLFTLPVVLVFDGCVGRLRAAAGTA